MYVEPVSNSTKLCWFVPIDYTDPETPLPRRFMVEFLSEEEREKFRTVFMQCSKEMQGHVVNHKLVSLLAAGSPRKETPRSKTPKSVSFKHSPEIVGTPTPEPSLEETPKKEPSESRPHNICSNLKQEFESLSQEIVTEPQETALISPQNTSIEITKEVLPAADKLAKEAELSLPKGFYNYEEKEGCVGCVGCEEEADQSNVSVREETEKKSSSPPALYEVIPALDPCVQANPFGLNTPVNSLNPVSPNTTTFGISPSSSPFTTPRSSGNIFQQNQPSSSGNIFQQQNTGNIFLQARNAENNIFMKSSAHTPAQTAKSTFNPFASPPMPSLSTEPAEYGVNDESYVYDEDEYEYDEYDEDNYNENEGED